MTDLVPLILCALDDVVRAKSLAAPEDADLAALADGLTLAVDHGALVAECRRDPNRKAPTIVETIVEVLTEGDNFTIDRRMSTSGWPNIVTVARRLADVAASLCVRGMTLRREAEALWKAASRLLGMEGVPACAAQSADCHIAKAVDDYLINESAAEVTRLQGQLAAEKRKHAEDDRALVEAHARELREAKEMHARDVTVLQDHLTKIGASVPSLRPKAPTRADGTAVLSDWTTTARAAIMDGIAYECTVYHGPAQGEMRVVVGLRDGKTLNDVAMVLGRMGRAPDTYSLREVRSPVRRPVARKCQHREDGNASACDHCSLKG